MSTYKPTAGIGNRLDEDIKFSDEWEEASRQITEKVKEVCEKTNDKTYGLFTTTEMLNNERFFGADNQSTRSVFRKVIDFGALPNNTSKTAAHAITWNANTHFVRIYGCATDPSTNSLPLPYSSGTLNKNIEVYLDVTNVTVVTSIDYSGYTTCYIVLEYIQS